MGKEGRPGSGTKPLSEGPQTAQQETWNSFRKERGSWYTTCEQHSMSWASLWFQRTRQETVCNMDSLGWCSGRLRLLLCLICILSLRQHWQLIQLGHKTAIFSVLFLRSHETPFLTAVSLSVKWGHNTSAGYLIAKNSHRIFDLFLCTGGMHA